MTRKRGSATQLLIWVMAVQAAVVGWLVPSQLAGSVPILLVAGVRVRLEELILLLALVWSGVRWLGPLDEESTPARPDKTNASWRIDRILLWAAGLGALQAAMRGHVAQNVEYLQEVRVLGGAALGFVIARRELRWVTPVRLRRTLCWAIVPAAVILVGSQAALVRTGLEALSSALGGVYGGLSVSVETLVVLALGVVWAEWYFGKRGVGTLALLLTLHLGVAARISKATWFQVTVLAITSLFLAGVKRRAARDDRKGRLFRGVSVWVLGGVVIGAILWLAPRIAPGEWEERTSRVRDRVLRPDADDDISGGRVEMARAGVEKAREVLVLGRGLGMWYEYWVGGVHVATWPDHFAPLWFLIRTGIVTTVALGLLYLRWLGRGLRALRRVEKERVALLAACLAYVVAIGAYSLIGVPQTLFEPAVLFSIAMAWIVSEDERLARREGWTVGRRRTRAGGRGGSSALVPS